MSYLSKTDPEIADIIEKERLRQLNGLELIASENLVSHAVLEAIGSIMTNKYAEGYPGKRYYGGCEFHDMAENLARDRLKKLFGAEHANVQPHSGTQANMAVYFAFMKLGEKILSMKLNQGGHLSHGSPVSFTGKFYQVAQYGVDPKTEMLDYGIVEEMARKEKPQDHCLRRLSVSQDHRFQSIPGDCGRRRGILYGRHRPYCGTLCDRSPPEFGRCCEFHDDHNS